MGIPEGCSPRLLPIPFFFVKRRDSHHWLAAMGVGWAYTRWPLLPSLRGTFCSQPPVPMLSAITTSNTRSILSNGAFPST